jgi:hypothetical protein
MDFIANCPGCGRKVRVPESLANQSVKCPECLAIFKPEGTARPGSEALPDEAQDLPRQPATGRPYDISETRPRRRWKQPHRGSTVLVLGILSLALFCFPLGIAAWVMGNNDLTDMRRGTMDQTGEGPTQAGRICGMISSILAIVGCVGYSVLLVISLAVAGPRGKF